MFAAAATMLNQRCVLFVTMATALAACGGASPTPPVIPDAPALSCPGSIAAGSLDGLPVPVSFVSPPATGGQAPVSVTCSATPGATFPVGATIVTCTATDALSRQAACNFAVDVSITPRIAKTRFLAFGDSITNGRCNEKENYCPLYTERVSALLGSRYVAQTFTFRTEGRNGEQAAIEGPVRLAPLLTSWHPEVLLLMEGTNDVHVGTAAARQAAIDGLDDMIRTALMREAIVFIATIPPSRLPENAQIPAFNDEVRALAIRRNVNLVDVWAAFMADPARYIGADDLHPSADGMLLIGDTFYNALRSALDITAQVPAGSAQ
jgi:lysophospholipase L1-like esterase